MAASCRATDLPSNIHQVEVIYDFLSNKTRVQLAGACGPHREDVLGCWTPIHSTYNSKVKSRPSVDALMYGGAARVVQSDNAQNGQALIYDRDIITMWKLKDFAAANEVYF